MELLAQNIYKKTKFKDRILSLVDQENIKIICPYLTLDIFKDIILEKNWKLITDTKALFLSTEKYKHIELIEFITKNNNKIKHLDKVHAKSIILEDKALFGSANFTNSGMNTNIELSAIINDSKKVNELKTWFDDLWEKTNELRSDIVDTIIDSIPITLYEIKNSTDNKVNFYSEDDYFINLVPESDFKKSDSLNFNTLPSDLFEGREPIKRNDTQIWHEKEVLITNKEVKEINFETLNIKNDYQLLNNEKSKHNISEENIHPATPIILGALLGFYKLIAKKDTNHIFYISNEEVKNINKLENLGFTYSSGKIRFEESKIKLKKSDKVKLDLLVRRYYQLYTNNSILSNPTYDKDKNKNDNPISCLYQIWEYNMK
jgi:hypothetical protein